MMRVASYILSIILYVCLLATDIKAGCPPSEYYNVSSYGSTCEYRCRCVGDVQCDDTGECAEGCALGWMGPGCQYRNVSPLYKSATQSGTTSSASNAVDGNVNTCSDTGVTNSGSSHWWKIEFHRNFYVIGLKITVPGDQTGNFRKFQVKSESSDGTVEHVCYQHPDEAGSRIMEVMCRQPVNTSRLIIQLDRADVALKLCKVEIYGGRLVSFNMITSSDSENHDAPITATIKWRKEHAVDGLLAESKPGVIDAQACFASANDNNPNYIYWWQVDLGRTYTIQDVNVFSRWSLKSVHAIDKQTKGYTISLGTSAGQFTSIFKDNPLVEYTPDFYQPRYSNLAIQMDADKVKLTRPRPESDRFFLCEVEVFAECPEDTCGWTCSIPCYCSDITTGTYKIDGTCPYGCKPGWKGDTSRCNTKCDQRRYGDKCLKQCGYCSEDPVVCDHVTGNCAGDCQAGYHGNRCDQECQDGQYGVNCMEKCSKNCRGSQPCNKKTGTCPSGCEQGWKGRLCIQPCVGGTYGHDCKDKCGHCSKGANCSTTLGECPGACDAGFQLPLCQIDCNDKTYGVNCTKTCGACRRSSECDKISGVCHEGCSPGWQETELCTQPCLDGTHGLNCLETCGYCSENATCDRQTGACPVGGCQSGYKESLCKQKVGSDDGNGGDEPSSALIPAIIAAVVVVLAIVVIVGFVCWRRRATGDSSTQGFSKFLPAILQSKSRRPDPTEPTESDTNETGFNPVAPFASNTSKASVSGNKKTASTGYMNSAETGHIKRSDVVAVREVRTVYALALEDVSTLHSKYDDLPQGFQHEVTEAMKPGNRSKNRYRDMYTYDQNRVVLPIIDEEDTSDYINASYIQGYRTSNAYIASQGTMPSTLTDMWRMIWHKDVRNVIMLTNCVEDGKTKCVQYWPESGEEVYGSISVTFRTETVCAEFTVRTFSCKLLTDDKTRTVTQFHYTAWPDKDVPYTELSLVQFWRKVKFSECATVTPWIVHCSAGVGRTGTFLALDYLYDQGKATGEVSIPACVEKLRDQRIKTVQTQHQYVFLYKAVPEVLDPIGSVCKTEQFREQLTDLRRSRDGPNTTKLHKEYKNMTDDLKVASLTECEYANISSISEEYAVSSKPGNLEKCRTPNILPLDVFRVVLPVESSDAGDFINAVRVSSYTQKNGIILTQFPMDNTAEDFVRMLWQYDLRVVVLMEDDIPKNGVYWPNDCTSCDVGPFTAEVIQDQAESSYTVRTIRYTRAGKTGSKDVTQFHFTSWPQGQAVPSDSSSVLQLLADVDAATRKGDLDKPIVVQCLNGADRSGLFCVLWTVLDRMKVEREVAIAETVRLLRSRRPQCIPSFEQYDYCHDVVNDYLDNFVEYANVM